MTGAQTLKEKVWSHSRIDAAARVPQSKYFDQRGTGNSVVKIVMNASQVNTTHIL